jgi:hypothetical protein
MMRRKEQEEEGKRKGDSGFTNYEQKSCVVDGEKEAIDDNAWD